MRPSSETKPEPRFYFVTRILTNNKFYTSTKIIFEYYRDRVNRNINSAIGFIARDVFYRSQVLFIGVKRFTSCMCSS